MNERVQGYMQKVMWKGRETLFHVPLILLHAKAQLKQKKRIVIVQLLPPSAQFSKLFFSYQPVISVPCTPVIKIQLFGFIVHT